MHVSAPRPVARERTIANRLVLISPVHNEAAHVERVVRAVAAQTRPPDAWVVVDDGSHDGTLAAIERLAEGLPFMKVLAAPRGALGSPDRLVDAAEARAFNWARKTAAGDDWAYIGKLDGDVELPPDYFERLLAELDRDPRLGIVGGRLVERSGSTWRRIPIPAHHVHGAVKLYRRACFEAIGGIEERLAWDTIDETYARMKGYVTRSYDDVVAVHHRPWGSADGTLRGRARHGRCAYIAHFSLPWVALRALKLASSRPRGVSGVAFLYGYLAAAARAAPRVDDDDFRRFVRRELRARAATALGVQASAHAGASQFQAGAR